jgi:hypothetical protein
LAQPVRQGKKRLSAIAGQLGVTPFSRDDFFYVTSKLAQEPDRLVLVGGQALETWGVLLKVPAPNGQVNPLTEDTDWLGSHADALWLANLLGIDSTELWSPPLDDPTPNTALIYLERVESQVLLMDFLRCVTGLENQEINQLAAEIEVPAPDGGLVRLRVLHPLHCLVSRMANLAVHPRKRQGNGPMQAHWAIAIVRAYLASFADQAAEGQIRKACQKVAEMAEFNHAEYCYLNFGIDPLQAVTAKVLAAGGKGFVTNDWPRTVARIEGKRQKWLDRQAYKKERAQRKST